MKSPTISPVPEMQALPDGFPGESELAALRAWYAGLSSREAVDRYLLIACRRVSPPEACWAGSASD